MTLRSLSLGQPPPKSASTETRLNWIIEALVKIDRWSKESPSSVAQGFTIANPTENRALDVGAATLAQVRQVVGTLLSDVAKGGQKQA